MNRKTVFSALAFLFFATFAFAQLQNGSTAPDWKMKDINNKVWHLYDLTAKGKTVFIDVSATWCGPCWKYHQRRSLDSLYEQHGPKGTIDKSCYVFFIEGDGTTTSSDLNGTGKRTVGNWLTGTDFPIINPGADTINQFCANYKIQYFPSIFMICPDNRIYLVGPGSMDVLFRNIKSGCPPVENKFYDKMNFGTVKSDQAEYVSGYAFHPLEKMFFLMRKRFSLIGK
jgi:hypothetical protein